MWSLEMMMLPWWRWENRRPLEKKYNFPGKKTAGQSWRAGSWGPDSNVLLVGMRVVTTEQCLYCFSYMFLFWALTLEKPMYPLRISEINESLDIISAWELEKKQVSKLSADGERQNSHLHTGVFQGNTLKKTQYVCSITEFIGAPFSYFGRSWFSFEETTCRT